MREQPKYRKVYVDVFALMRHDGIMVVKEKHKYERMAHMNTNINQNANELPVYTEKNGITYQLVGDVYLPLIAVDDKPRKSLGY